MRQLTADRRGSVAFMGAFSLIGLLALSALSVDIGHGLSQRVRNQTVADSGALAAALIYAASNSTENLQAAARDIAAANGLADATVTATVVNDYPTAGAQSVRVDVISQVPVFIGKAVGLGPSFNVRATAYALLGSSDSDSSSPACFLALASSGNGITLSGGATIVTPDCAVAAVSSIYNNSTGITAGSIIAGTGGIENTWGTLSVANEIRYATSFTNPDWNHNVPSADKRVNAATSLSDPLADNADLAAARALIGSYAAPASISNPSTSGGQDWNLTWSPGNNVKGYRTSDYSSSYVIPPGNYTINTLTIAGGMTVTFQSGSTITVRNGVSIGGGSTVVFGDTDLKVNGGFNSGSAGVTFGNGDIEIGSGTVTFSGTNVFGDGDITINATVTLGGGSSMTMGAGDHAFGRLNLSGGGWMKLGNGNLDVINGISVGGGSTLAAGRGNYRIGPYSSNNRAIDLSGSAVFIMGDGAFSANGDIYTQGGSRLVFGKTLNHFINGNMTIAGSVLFGTSRYTINGNFTNGTGGTTWPYYSNVTGQTYGNTLEGVSVSGYDMAGVDVTFILNGTLNLAGGAKTKLIASSTGVSGGAIRDVLVDSLTASATNWAAGAQSLFVGAVHLPNSSVTMSGGTTTLSGTQCFMLIANYINASGGAAAGSACAGIGGGAGGGGGGGGSPTIKLVG